MSAFLVISTSDRLNWIVDGIEECHPQNPNVETYIGTGKLEHRTNGLYYIHNYTAKDDINNGEEEVVDFQSLIANQFAHFRRASGVLDNLQIFILDNPVDEESLEYSRSIYNQIDNVIQQKKYENNCSLTRILFSYDISRPCDVCLQVPSDILQSNIADAASKAYTQICYIDNQNRDGAAVALSSESHNLMLPRMLCDFMMLMSSENSQYNVRNAIHNETRIFSLGYAECMYYYKDVQRYFELAYRYDIRKRMLNEINSSVDSLEYNIYPLGISERVQRFSPVYSDVAFDMEIADYPLSVDKQIDDIIVSLQSYIVAFKQEALEKAIVEDSIAMEEKRKEAVENGRTEDFVITTRQDEIEREYPDYINRCDIYKLWNIERSDTQTFDDNEHCVVARNQYLKLIDFIQTPAFKRFIVSSQSNNADAASVSSIQQPVEKQGCNIFAKLFRKNMLVADMLNTSTKKESPDSIIEVIVSIRGLLEQKQKYQALCTFEERLIEESKQLEQNMSDFKLTSHCSSYGSLIDVEKLKQYQHKTSSLHMDSIIRHWNELEDKMRNLDALYTETNKECTQEVAEFHYINWDNPAAFVKTDIDVEDVCQNLKDLSIPLVNSLVIRPEQENNTTYTYYTDSETWFQLVANKQVTLQSSCTMELSMHLASKIAIFQILQWDDYIRKGLTDICDTKSSNQ